MIDEWLCGSACLLSLYMRTSIPSIPYVASSPLNFYVLLCAAHDMIWYAVVLLLLISRKINVFNVCEAFACNIRTLKLF
jgi:hypothetical protein